MKEQPAHIMKPDSVTIVLPEGPVTIRRGQVNYVPLVEAIKLGDWDKAMELSKPARFLNVLLKNTDFVITDSEITYKNEPLRGYLCNKILASLKAGFPVEHLLAFLKNLENNPSYNAREELYKFLETEDLPVTADGHFLAYKAVRADFLDKHSGTLDNSVGKTVRMPRAKVDDDQSRGCSSGLHAGSLAYVRGFGNESSGDKFLIVKINPQDVVCIPKEDCRKLRCSEYVVVGLMKGEMVHHAFQEDGMTPICGTNKNDEVVEVEEDWDDWGDSCSDDDEEEALCDLCGEVLECPTCCENDRE